jgi:hypothetical protein
MRISATTLESFRLYCDQEWMTEGELLATIKGLFVPTHNVQLGAAFGKVIERPDVYRADSGYTCDGFNFGDDVMAPCFAVIDRRGLFEVKATKPYSDCTIVAKTDHLLGARLSEFKTTLGSFDFDKYAASYQWRFMADIFQPVSITYHVFCLAEATNGVISLRGVESFQLYPYAELHQDCCDLLRRFCAYVRAKGLDGFLRERQQQSEAA